MSTHLQELLRNASIRSTPSRLALLEQIHGLAHPFSVQSLYESTTAKADLATIYRFVNLLVAHRILREITQQQGVTYYELACQHNPVHPHFYCDQCQKISCLQNLQVEDALRLANYASFSQIEHISVLINGTCEACIKKAALVKENT